MGAGSSKKRKRTASGKPVVIDETTAPDPPPLREEPPVSNGHVFTNRELQDAISHAIARGKIPSQSHFSPLNHVRTGAVLWYKL